MEKEGVQRKVDEILAGLSEALEDGVTLRFVGIEGSTAHVRLEIDPEECDECLTPREVLQGILLTRFKDRSVGVTSVQIVESPPEGETRAAL
jgi:hypothetical protein